MKYHCSCGKSFNNLEYLELHMKTHTGEGLFSCQQCGKVFTCREGLDMHICRSVPMLLPSAKYGTIHVMSPSRLDNDVDDDDNDYYDSFLRAQIKVKRRAYQCEFCEDEFETENYLDLHLRTHTGEGIFPCEECGLLFTDESGLKTHRHRWTKVSCHLCDKTFSQMSFLDIHLREHLEFTGKLLNCNLCDKTFLQVGALQTHMRTHPPVMPYHCLMCGQKFSLESRFSAHVMMHRGEKDWQDYKRAHCIKETVVSFYRTCTLERIGKNISLRNGEEKFRVNLNV
ncbi:zinc finger and BTB domain-containing protein 41-like [Saccoglossus kowalevskii]|uniref:Zinc finger protein 845-like n=1 Tax=Saccoglossus kowalevskii TaxID=10224 RepID=A0ABM0M0J1_SACKO|nr:PREDICTED: zinc finger protein 845-like [Saccoglossus kowalevskii]